MNVHIRLFARARDLAGAAEIELQLNEPVTVGDVKRALARNFPPLAPLANHLLVAIDRDYANDAQPVFPDAEIACFPPVSGG